ncbi:hypothetical protein LADH09A_004173 [Micromonospora sp. LAH09]|uniref:hypothetical protein n=1 Tax=Micromonospora cabrerizensis TaxID=2911213 RepID=UPI001EE99074|nr:hypothetical protein [Micromonospora cabrerizensis]MCG5470229.1 hypothetical protein [Micromonospora cabrerizensis]
MTGRRTGRALLAGGLLLALLAPGCGVRPSDVIRGRPAVSGPAQGMGLYLLARGELVLVLRPAKADPSPADALALLAAGPEENERRQGFTSDVPAGLDPVTVTSGADPSGGLTVRTTTAARPLSADAADQIICTVADAAAQVGFAENSAPVTIVGPDGARPPRRCPIR